MSGVFSQTLRRAGFLVAGLLLLAQAVLPATASANWNPNPNEVAYWCDNYDGGVKFDTGAVGTHVKAPITITIVDNGKTELSNATGDGVSITKIIIKGGSNGGNGGNGNQYYTPPFTYPLKAPNNNGGQQADISHVIVCYDNLPTGSIKVNKKVDTDGDGDYDGDNTEANQIGFKWGLDGSGPTRSMGSEANNLQVGNHTVTENSLNGYVFTGWYYTGETGKSCTNPRGDSLPITVAVEKNKTKSVTLCNKLKKGSITIVKDAQPNDEQNFNFYIDKIGSSSFDEDFWLDDNGSESTANGGLKSSKMYDNLTKATYVITERGTDSDWQGWKMNGWSLKDITCSEGGSVTIDESNRKVTIELDYGDAVTCTFINQKHGKIKVKKYTDPDGDHTKFDLTATVLNGDGQILSDPTRQIADGEYEYFEVKQGTYKIAETLPPSWVQTSTTCDSVTVSANNLYPSCEIHNSKKGELVVHKHTNPDGDTTQFGIQATGSGTISGNANRTIADGETEVFQVTAGTYSVSETVPDGWAMPDNGCVDIAVAAGQTKHCHIYNTKKARITIIKETLSDSDDNFGFDSTGGEFELGNGQSKTFDNLNAGVFNISELETTGWSFEDTVCSKESSWAPNGVSVTLAPGDDVTCTFYNSKDGDVSGFKFNDVNGNGLYDEGEEKLSDWTITLTKKCENYYSARLLNITNDIAVDCEDQLIGTTKTDSFGNYSFENLKEGEYLVCEVQQAGWIRTYPSDSDCHEFSIDESGKSVTANFGNKAKDPGQVLGTSTPEVLANTGTPMLQGLIVGLSIIGAASGITYFSRRKQTASL